LNKNTLYKNNGMFCSKLERTNPSRNGIDAIRPAKYGCKLGYIARI